jgi:hypothetical protein
MCVVAKKLVELKWGVVNRYSRWWRPCVYFMVIPQPCCSSPTIRLAPQVTCIAIPSFENDIVNSWSRRSILYPRPPPWFSTLHISRNGRDNVCCLHCHSFGRSH